MYQNSPWFRFALYLAAVVAQIVAWFAGDLEVSWAPAMQRTAHFLGALGGITAIGNLSGPQAGAVQRVRHWQRRLGVWRARREQARRV